MTVDRSTDVEIRFRLSRNSAHKVMSEGVVLGFDTNGQVRWAGTNMVEGAWWTKPIPDPASVELVDEGPAALTWDQWVKIVEWLVTYVGGIDGYDEAFDHLNQGYIDPLAILTKVEAGE